MAESCHETGRSERPHDAFAAVLCTAMADAYDQEAAQARYAAFSRLQATAVAYGVDLKIPEIVVLGGQSDGKSTLLEAFLGFRFNVREVEMGTRRPLLVQMRHDPSAREPVCRLQDEGGSEFGPAISPPSAVSDAIRERAEAHLKRRGTAVSEVPIVLRAEYAFAPNLTLIDTPGFVLKAKAGDPPSTPADIVAMVRALCAPRHRLLVFLQQSSVEWASSPFLDLARELDPTFARTVLVASKFDHRLSELEQRRETDAYLGGSGFLPPAVRPFFVALPKDRANNQESEAWREAIRAVDASVARRLREDVEGGYDEERFGDRVGFFRLKEHLENELAARYREATPHTLFALKRRVEEAQAEAARARGRLRALSDVVQLRRNALAYVLHLTNGVLDRMLTEPGANPAACLTGKDATGLSTAQERAASEAQWPAQAHGQLPPGATLRLSGSAALERFLHEFRTVADTVEMAPLPSDRVSNSLALSFYSRGGGSDMTGVVARRLAAEEAERALTPLFETAARRIAEILTRAYLEAASDAKKAHPEVSCFPAFHVRLREAFEAVSRQAAARVVEVTRHQLAAACSPEGLLALGAGVSGGSGGMGGRHQTQDAERTPSIAREADGRRRTSFGIPEEEDDAVHMTQIEAVTPQPRLPMAELSENAVPETPSPDLASSAAKGGPVGRKAALAAAAAAAATATAATAATSGAALARQAPSPPPPRRAPKAARVDLESPGAGSADACRRVERAAASAFRAARRAATGPLVLASMRRAALGGLRGEVEKGMVLDTCSLDDAAFTDLFSEPAARQAAEQDAKDAEERADGLAGCVREFERVAASIA